MKKHILKREKFLDKYLKTYRNGLINLGASNETVDSFTKKFTLVVNDLRRMMKINGLNFIKNERAERMPKCALCQNKVGSTGALRIKEGLIVCEKCIVKEVEEHAN